MRNLVIIAVASLAVFLPSQRVREPSALYRAYQPKTALKTASEAPQAPLKKTYEDLLGGNDYAPGNCTSWVAQNIPVIAGLGNANTWDDRAAQYGVPISDVPKVGAVAQRDGGLGHVAFVVAVDGDSVLISEMNSLGLYVVDEKWVMASEYRYLYF